MKRLCHAAALAAALLLPAAAAAQQRPASAPRPVVEGRVVEGRVVEGWMWGSQITARATDGRAAFDYRLTRAQVVDGRLVFAGRVTRAGKSSDAGATLVGTLARSANPWPSAADRPANRQSPAATAAPAAPAAPAEQRQGRETRNPEATSQVGQLAQATQPTARTTPTPGAPQRPAGEANEQTQSLYSAGGEAGSGCEVLFLKLQAPQPVQLGVVLAHQDNPRGLEINQAVCRVVRGLEAKADVTAQVSELNGLLAR